MNPQQAVQRSLTAGAAAAVFAGFAAATVLAAAQPGELPREVPPGSPVADPNDPEKTRTIISREEREKLGLTQKTWSGVVHPEVYATLDSLNEKIANLKTRMERDRDFRAFQLLFSATQTEGTVYVEVQLKNKDARKRVLGSLKASEFRVRQLLDQAAGFVGYATREGLDKLAKHPDVIGVCVDNKPLPDAPVRIIHRDDLPPAQAGEAAGPGAREDKVEPDVYRMFALTDRPYVMVNLRADSLPQLTDEPSEMLARERARREVEKTLQDRILCTISADDFYLQARAGSAISGFITPEGLEKLQQHPDVLRIKSVSRVQFPVIRNNRPFLP
jgi:hypothetical protein